MNICGQKKGGAGKAIARAVTRTAVTSTISITIALLPILLIVGILTALFDWFLNNETQSLIADVVQGKIQVDGETVDLSNYIAITDDKNIEYKADNKGRYIRDIMQLAMREAGLSAPEGMEANEILDDMINAEIVTNYPYLGGDGLQGIVNFYRRSYDAEEDDEGTLMTYVNQNEFNKLMKKR